MFAAGRQHSFFWGRFPKRVREFIERSVLVLCFFFSCHYVVYSFRIAMVFSTRPKLR